MKYLKQFLIILVFTLAGEALNYFVPLPVPAGVYGIVLLFLALETGAVKTEQVEDTGKFLIEIMPVTFISPAVGLIDAWADVKGNLLAYIAVTAVTTVLVMSVSALLTQGVIRLRRKKLATEKTPAPRAAIGNTLNGELAAENCEADGNARKAETARNGREDSEK